MEVLVRFRLRAHFTGIAPPHLHQEPNSFTVSGRASWNSRILNPFMIHPCYLCVFVFALLGQFHQHFSSVTPAGRRAIVAPDVKIMRATTSRNELNFCMEQFAETNLDDVDVETIIRW